MRQRVIRHYYGSDAEEVWGVSQMNSGFFSDFLNCATACFCPGTLQKSTRRLSVVVSYSTSPLTEYTIPIYSALTM